jgi:hypothetical protein
MPDSLPERLWQALLVSILEKSELLREQPLVLLRQVPMPEPVPELHPMWECMEIREQLPEQPLARPRH